MGQGLGNNSGCTFGSCRELTLIKLPAGRCSSQGGLSLGDAFEHNLKDSETHVRHNDVLVDVAMGGR
jgi:hypothetical protein